VADPDGASTDRGELPGGHRAIEIAELSGRERYDLMTSLVVPRPIAWVSTWGPEGSPNLAPFSYFAALSTTPAIVGISIGARRGALKDTLVNARRSGALCVNVVGRRYLEAMNGTSAEVGPEVDEFDLVGLQVDRSDRVDAPFVAGCPAVLECLVLEEVDLPRSANVLLLAEVVRAQVDGELLEDRRLAVDPARLAPVGRLGGGGYMTSGEFVFLSRP